MIGASLTRIYLIIMTLIHDLAVYSSIVRFASESGVPKLTEI